MVRIEARTARVDGVTLVEATLLHDGPGSRRVRVESELDGPVWPPRRQGVPEAGWDREAGTLTVEVSPGDRLGIGFATPADPADPPVSVVESERVGDGGGGIGSSAAAVVRALGDPSPPPDALPAPAGSDPDPEKRSDDSGFASPPTDDPERDDANRRATADPSVDRSAKTDPDPAPGGYPAVAAWLSAVERRIHGGPDDRLAADAKRLRAVARRAITLAERADRPVERGSGPPATGETQPAGETR